MIRPAIVITGGAQRLGLAMAKALLARKEALIISYRSERAGVNELRAAGATLIQADFASDAGILDFIDKVKGLNIPIKALVNNASEWKADPGKDAPLSALAEAVDRMMQIHVKAPMLISEGLAPLMQEHSAIVNMTDWIVEAGSAKHLAYAASKAALSNLTSSLARKYAPAIRVNSIAPGLISFNEWDDEDYRLKTRNKSLLKTEPGEQEAVNGLLYLLDSDYITGRTLHLDGGRHLNFP